ncbi:hypothetical protein KP509_29G038600 [Ceratopteris richardii]|uniref:Uncharacterized protein n=1 Tax=Ceratopteris richardii TaxID=49495 RepID=A0A8T2R8F8_CERRI|nr:hypothetical protein KP509_29G038600 [Ceratopteris richardii]
MTPFRSACCVSCNVKKAGVGGLSRLLRQGFHKTTPPPASSTLNPCSRIARVRNGFAPHVALSRQVSESPSPTMGPVTGLPSTQSLSHSSSSIIAPGVYSRIALTFQEEPNRPSPPSTLSSSLPPPLPTQASSESDSLRSSTPMEVPLKYSSPSKNPSFVPPVEIPSPISIPQEITLSPSPMEIPNIVATCPTTSSSTPEVCCSVDEAAVTTSLPSLSHQSMFLIAKKLEGGFDDPISPPEAAAMAREVREPPFRPKTVPIPPPGTPSPFPPPQMPPIPPGRSPEPIPPPSSPPLSPPIGPEVPDVPSPGPDIRPPPTVPERPPSI